MNKYVEEISGAKRQYLNLLKVDKLIRSGSYPSSKELSQQTELSQRQVMRILKSLKEEYNAPIHYDRERKGYCYLVEGFSISDLSFDEDESFALQVCYDFVARTFAGSHLFSKLHKGIASLLSRVETFDRMEGRIMAERIQLAATSNAMNFSHGRRQKDFEDILYKAIKEGVLLNVSWRREENEIEQETCLPLLVVMHEDFTWVLFYVKATAFSADYQSATLNLDSFGIKHFSSITAVNLYRDSHGKNVCLPNKISFTAQGAVGTVDNPTPEGRQKGLLFGFNLSFSCFKKDGCYQVILYYVLDEKSFEYKLEEDYLLNSVLYEGQDIFS